MQVPYQISEDDYVKSVKLSMKFRLRTKLIFLCVLALLVLIYFLSPPCDQAEVLPILAGAMAGTVVLLLLRYIVTPFQIRRHYRKYKMIQQQFMFELLEDGPYFATPSSSGVLKWEQMLKWRQNDDFILIYIMPRLFNIIPKSLAKNGVEINQLIEQLYNYLGKPR